MRRRRLRGLALAAGALACGTAASAQVSARDRELEATVGRPVEVLVAARDLPAGARIRTRSAARLFERRSVPERFVPAGALADPAEAAGLRAAVAIPAGSYATAALFEAPGDGAAQGPAALRPGERAVELAVAADEGLLAAGTGGTRVDVLVTTEGRDGGGRTRVALEAAELLALRRAEEGAAEPGDGPQRARYAATLRVGVRDAVFLTAADSFAREIRLLARGEGDRRAAGGLSAVVGGPAP